VIDNGWGEEKIVIATEKTVYVHVFTEGKRTEQGRNLCSVHLGICRMNPTYDKTPTQSSTIYQPEEWTRGQGGVGIQRQTGVVTRSQGVAAGTCGEHRKWSPRHLRFRVPH
jgi:hypothetical protein